MKSIVGVGGSIFGVLLRGQGDVVDKSLENATGRIAELDASIDKSLFVEGGTEYTIACIDSMGFGSSSANASAALFKPRGEPFARGRGTGPATKITSVLFELQKQQPFLAQVLVFAKLYALGQGRCVRVSDVPQVTLSLLVTTTVLADSIRSPGDGWHGAGQ